jgi:hypothetical protein
VARHPAPLPPPQLPYLLPLLDTLPYGRYLFLQVSTAAAAAPSAAGGPGQLAAPRVAALAGAAAATQLQPRRRDRRAAAQPPRPRAPHPPPPAQFPFIARALAPLGPVNALYHLFPFAPFIIFLGVYSGIVNNQSLSRYIRYNAMQAVLLDILLM